MAKLLSIDIGCTNIKIVEMDYKAKKPKVYSCVEIPTPTGAVHDGCVDEAHFEAVVDVIRDALKANKLRTKRVLFTVFSSKIITREIVLPGVKAHQINAVIESNITEYFPIELDEYKISHMHITTFKDGENAGKHKVLVIAAEKTLLESYEKLAAALNLNIVDVDYAGNSAYQAVKNSAGQEAVMAVKVEYENALITIIKNGVLVMQRTVNYGFEGEPEPETEDDRKQRIADVSRVLVGTVLRVIDFYISNNEDGRIETVYLMGEGSKSEALTDVMKEQTQLPCRVLDTVRGTTAVKTAQDADINLFAAAIGAGMSSVGFDAEKEKERNETNYVSASLLMVVLVVVVIVAMLSISLIPYNAALMEQTSLQRKQQQLEPAKLVYDQYNGMLDLIAKVRYGQALTHNSNDTILDFLDELEDTLPSDV
jgi:Tfp pilus assembly PilM family ATPase